MRKELKRKLIERWPKWFNTEGDVRFTAMPRGFEHDDGWFDLLWRLCEDLEPLVRAFEESSGLKFEALQVKGKFGGLRIHVNHTNDAIRHRNEATQQESFRICEVCAMPGKLREGGWIRLCATSTQALWHENNMAELTHEQLWKVRVAAP